MSGDMASKNKYQLTALEEKFLLHASIISNYFKNDCLTEWTLDTDRNRIQYSVNSGLYYDRQLISGDWTLKDEETRGIDLITEILVQKLNELSRNINGAKIFSGILNIYGFQDISDQRKFFKIPIFKLIRSDYEGAYYVLANGMTFNDSELLFNFIENMPLSTTCVPSLYECYIKQTLSRENELSLFKTQNICENCFDECIIEIDFINLVRKLIPNNNGNINMCEYLYDRTFEKIPELIEKLATTVETNSCDTMIDIENMMKIETFVHTAILCGIIEKLELTWERPLTAWRSIKKEAVGKERRETIQELLYNIDQGPIYDAFIKYWAANKNLLFVKKDEEKTICTFRLNGIEKCDLESFIKEVGSNCKTVDFLSGTYSLTEAKYSCKTITFKDGKSFKIIFNEIIPGHILGCAIMRNVDAFFDNKEKILPLKIFPSNDDSPNEEMEVVVYKDLDYDSEEKLKLQNFLQKAEKEQEFIAKTQGHFNPRILLKPDNEALERFVEVVIFGLEKNDSYEGLSEKDRNKMIKKIVCKIIKVAKKFGEKRDRFVDKNIIYYDAIHLYGYKFSDFKIVEIFKKTKQEDVVFRFPLFKVFENEDDKDPILIDVDCNTYDNWKKFLERNVLGKGTCLCVPKDGRYIDAKTNKIEIQFLKNNPIYWTPERAALVGVNAAFLIGSTALAFYSGPIGWGVRALTLSNPVRFGIAGVGICSSSIGLGITLSKKGLFISDKFQSKAPSIIFLLNVTSDILVLYGETSVYASIAAAALIPATVVLSGSLICKLLFEAINKYKETGTIDKADVWRIVNASLLFGNSIFKFPYVKKFIESTAWANKLPTFSKLSTPSEKFTNTILNPNQLARFFIDVSNKRTVERVSDLFKNTADYFRNNKTLDEFKNDLKDFAKNLTVEIAESVEPQIDSFLMRRFGVTLKNLTGSNHPFSEALEEYIPKIYLFILHGINKGKALLREIKKLLGLDKFAESLVEEATRNVAETSLAVEGPLDQKSKIEKLMKAEEFVRSAAHKKEIEKLISYLNNDSKITPELMDKVLKETIDEITNDANQSQFKTDFEEYCSNYEKLILLEEDDNNKLYVFQYKTEDDLEMVLQEEKLDIERLRKIEENMFIYKDLSQGKTVLIFSDNCDPDDRIGYMIICYNEKVNL